MACIDQGEQKLIGSSAGVVSKQQNKNLYLGLGA
jgi:hypothetical protein